MLINVKPESKRAVNLIRAISEIGAILPGDRNAFKYGFYSHFISLPETAGLAPCLITGFADEEASLRLTRC
jgi:hypothetical protein